MTHTLEIPTFEEGRLRYRMPRLEDMERHFEFLASDRSLGVGGPYKHRQDSFDRLSSLYGHWALRGYGRWLIADRETDEALGVVGLFYPDDWPEPEIGWTVFNNAEGRGIAYEAAQFSRLYAYRTLGWTRVVSCIVPSNTRSIALAQRMDAAYEADFHHPDIGVLQVWRHVGPEAL